MRAKHVHAELIKAWADGAEIESRLSNDENWSLDKCPMWHPYAQYRIKPTPRVARRWWINVCDAGYAFASMKQAEIFSRGNIIESVPVIEILPEEDAT